MAPIFLSLKTIPSCASSTLPESWRCQLCTHDAGKYGKDLGGSPKTGAVLPGDVSPLRRSRGGHEPVVNWMVKMV
jgi:hypothetical protein